LRARLRLCAALRRGPKGPQPKDAATAKPKPVTAKAKAAGEGGADPKTDETESTDHLFAYSESSAANAGDASSPAAAEVKQAPLCATSAADLAKQAGISQTELTIIQSLGARRQQLDARESSLNSQAQLIDAASAKLDGRIKQMADLKAQVQALLGQANKQADDDQARMIKVYESMKPKDAAAVLATMSDDVRLPIAAKMKEAKLAAVLGAMGTDQARDLTEKLANRMKKTTDASARLNQVAGGAGVKPAAPAPAKP
jgi:flagellar motility protein MotE (MotC chaperone)